MSPGPPPAQPPGSASGDDKPETSPSEGGPGHREDPPEWEPTTDPVAPVPLAGQVMANLSVSDQSQLSSLLEYLRLATPAARVLLVAGQAGRGEQGALDQLRITADRSALIAAVNTLPEFLRSRKVGFSVTLTTKGTRITITATNADQVTEIIASFLDS